MPLVGDFTALSPRLPVFTMGRRRPSRQAVMDRDLGASPYCPHGEMASTYWVLAPWGGGVLPTRP